MWHSCQSWKVFVSRASFADLNLKWCSKNRTESAHLIKRRKQDGRMYLSADRLKVTVNSREIWSLISSQLLYELRSGVAFSFAPSVQHNNEPVHLDEWSNFLQETIQNVKGCFKGLRLLWRQNTAQLLVDIFVPYTSYNFSFPHTHCRIFLSWKPAGNKWISDKENPHFFSVPAYLTVSGQLHLEVMAG